MKKMMRRFLLSRIFLFCVAAVGFALASCSGNDYVCAIPSSATAVVRIDASSINDPHSVAILRRLLPMEDVKKCGIDFNSSIYAFETVDGNFGLCAKIASRGKFDDALATIASSGKCSKARKMGDACVSDLGGSWALCYSDKALLVIGPVAAASISDMQRRMVRMLGQDDEASIVSRPMFQRLDSMSGSVAMVAQMQALPEKFMAPFALGAPKDADPSQILVEATMNREKSVLTIRGESFSFNASVNKSLAEARNTFRKNKGTYAAFIPNSAQLCMYANVDGNKFLPLIQGNRALQALLAGLNTVVDFDKIMRSTNGDFLFCADGTSANPRFSMVSELANQDWVADVDYWKESCSGGSTISGNRAIGWKYSSDNMSFDFGSNDKGWFYASSDAGFVGNVRGSQPLLNSASRHLQSLVVGNRMVMIVNLTALVGEVGKGDDDKDGIANVLSDITGGIDAIVYIGRFY